jgi:hypothetical protein
MFITDPTNLRVLRQANNNSMVVDGLMTGDLSNAPVNQTQLDRVLADLGWTIDELFDNMDEAFAIALSHSITIQASRQGTRDEAFIIQGISDSVAPLGINITNLDARAYRPTKDGRIVQNQKSQADDLKSFDGQIEGEVNGWIFAKVVVGSGGHQDNVKNEAVEYGDWAVEYGDPSLDYVMLIDGDDVASDLVDMLSDRYADYPNIYAVDHIDLQTKLGVVA